VEWIKVLSDDTYKMIIIDAIEYYHQNKGLNVFGYCIMPNHVHMIVQAEGKLSISEILRDLKKFTSRSITNKLETEKPEAYQEILDRFMDAGKKLKRIAKYKVWQDGNRAKLIYSNKFLLEKLNYVHNNPVEYGLCDVPWHYIFSSATNYSDKKSVLEVILLSM